MKDVGVIFDSELNCAAIQRKDEYCFFIFRNY